MSTYFNQFSMSYVANYAKTFGISVTMIFVACQASNSFGVPKGEKDGVNEKISQSIGGASTGQKNEGSNPKTSENCTEEWGTIAGTIAKKKVCIKEKPDGSSSYTENSIWF